MRILDLLHDNLPICSVRTCVSICKFWYMTPHTYKIMSRWCPLLNSVKNGTKFFNTSQVQYADFMMHVEQGNAIKAASGLTDIIQRAAYSMKCRSPRTHNTCTCINNKQRANAEWWSADCEMAKTDKQYKLRTYRNYRSDGYLHIYLNSKTNIHISV